MGIKKIIILTLIVIFGLWFPSYLLVVPAHATLTLDASVFVGESYTNNLFFTFANKREDFGTFVTPRLTLKYESENVVVAGTYTGTGQFYVNNPGANTFINGADLFFDLPFLTKRFDRLEIQLNESFNISPQLPAFSSIASDQSTTGGNAGGPLLGGGPGTLGGPGNLGGPGTLGGPGIPGGSSSLGLGLAGNSLNNQGIILNRSTISYQNRAGFRATYHFNSNFSQSLEYSNMIQEFTSSQFQDSISHRVTTHLEHQVTQQWGVNLGYTFQKIDFQGSGVSTFQGPGGTGAGTSHTLSMGTGYRVSPTFPVNAQIGLTHTETETQSDVINFTGNFGISKIFSSGEATLNYLQQIGNAGGLAAATTLNQTIFLRANQQVTQYVSIFGSLGYGRNRSLAGPAIRLNSYQASGGVRVAILSWLSGIGTYSYQNQDSSGTFGNTAQSHNIFLGLTATAPSWRLFK